MNKNILWICVILLIGYLTLVYCDDQSIDNEAETEAEQKDSNALTDLIEEGRRRRRRHGLWGHHHHMWGWHALAIAYWVKVKVVIVSFFLGSALFLGLRYFWPHKCHSDVVHEGPIVYDHNPHTVDHIPYSLDHAPSHFEHHDFTSSGPFPDHHDFSSSGPYSAYGGGYSEVEATQVTDVVEPTAPTSSHIFKKRDVSDQKVSGRAMSPEELIGDFMFQFLGLDSKACRRRFICEMEFRSKRNQLTDMAFRIVGRGFFDIYTNDRNNAGHANSFAECALVNPECVFIEQNIDDEAEHTNAPTTEKQESAAENSVEDNGIVGDDMEMQNTNNLKAEKMNGIVKKSRKHRKLDIIAERILGQSN